MQAIRGNGAGWKTAIAIGILVLLGSPAFAAERETRAYTVNVDGKRAGDAQVSIAQQDDGTTQVNCETNVKVRVLFFKYTYWYRGQETWKNGRLQKLESTSDDDGKRFTTVAVAEPTGMKVTVNGRTRVTSLDVWPTSYWQLPDSKLRGGQLLLLDADTGRDLQARMQHLGTQQIYAGGKTQNAAHYRLTGKVTVDLWFDASERMIRQDWVEDGHRTVIELARIDR